MRAHHAPPPAGLLMAAPALLAAAWVTLRAANLASNVSLPLERSLARTVVVLFAVSLALGAWLGARHRLGPLLTTTGGAVRFALLTAGFALVYAVATGVVSRAAAPAGVGGLHLHWDGSFGPLTAWPALEATWPEAGVAAHLTLGHAIVLLALAPVVAAALALLAHQASARRGGAPALAGATLAPSATAACATCGPLIAPGLALLGGAAAPLATAVANPASPVGALLEVAGPLLALWGLLRLAAPTACGDAPTRRLPTARAAAVMAPFIAAPALVIHLAAWGRLPEGDSPAMEAISALYDQLTILALLMLALALGGLTWLIARYRHRPDEAWEPWRAVFTDAQRRRLMVAFVAVPAAVLIATAVLSFGVFMEMGAPPGGTTHVNVTAQQFAFQFEYPDGNTSFGTLRVAEDELVFINVTSRDVIHNLFVPDLGVKVDAVPGRTNTYWFRALAPGTYEAHCAEFCGAGHAGMAAAVEVFPEGSQERPYGNAG